MTSKNTASQTMRRPASKVEIRVCVGREALAAGKLIYFKDGAREFSQFAYRDEWLADDRAFDISPDLVRTLGYQLRKPPTNDDSTFFLALGDTEADAWGRRLIARAHARARKLDPSLTALSELDYLCAVDDFSRMGALRLQNNDEQYLRSVAEGKRATPVFLDLDKILTASRAVELGQETTEDLRYLQGKGTSLGGMRPKCTILDEEGMLALGKLPSVKDERSVTRAEVLALRLAARAGIDTPQARIVTIQGLPIAVISRFDRTGDQARIPYISGVTLLQAGKNEEHSYTEIIDEMRGKCADFAADAQQLWRRLVFNYMITNVDDHLQNIGFLYAGRNYWRLAPAFDLNPFPDKDRESKTWLSEDTGPIVSVNQLLDQATRFLLRREDAERIVAEVVRAVTRWRDVALSPEVGLTVTDLKEFAPAFEKSRG